MGREARHRSQSLSRGGLAGSVTVPQGAKCLFMTLLWPVCMGSS
jgi:hypothetical protein